MLLITDKMQKVINLFYQEINNNYLLDWHPTIQISKDFIEIIIYKGKGGNLKSRRLCISKENIEIACLDPISLSLFLLGQFKSAFEKPENYFSLNIRESFRYNQSFDKLLRDNGYYGE